MCTPNGNSYLVVLGQSTERVQNQRNANNVNPFVHNIVMICAISGIKVDYPHSIISEK